MDDVDTSNGCTQIVDESNGDGCYAEDSNKLIIKKTLPNTPVNSNTLIPIVCNKPLPKPFIVLTDQQNKKQLKIM